MTFIQIIENRTDRIDEVKATLDSWIEQTASRRNVSRGTQAQDRGARGTYLQVVEFPSYDDARTVSAMPETQAFAAQLANLCDGPPMFRDVDVTRDDRL